MKKFKKVMALGLALALIFSSMGNVFAYTLDGKNYDGFQVGDTFYSLQYANSHVDSFRDVFSHENPDNVIIDFNKKPVVYKTLINAVSGGVVINDFDAWAATAARPNPPQTPNKLYKPDGTLVTIGDTEPELTVVDVDVLDRTHIQVEFSDGVTKTYAGYDLHAGSNTVTFRYEGIDFTKTVTYTPSDAKVENIQFVDYRTIRVTFDDEVDLETAADASNYYFEIVDGNAALGAFPDLGLSNQLSEIETTYTGGAPKWWANGNITAVNKLGKTVVDIHLPEDARFTNVEDKNTISQGGPGSNDDERTLTVLQRDSMMQREDNPAGIRKELEKGKTFIAAVRNVLDADGKASIDTFVKTLTVLDQVRPKLLTVSTDKPEVLKSNPAGLGVDLGTLNILRTREQFSQVKEDLVFEYSEPVFDTHDMNKSDFEFERDIYVYVNGRLVATTNDWDDDLTEDDKPLIDFEDLVQFDMSAQGDYDEAVLMTINAELAAEYLEDNWGEDFLVNKPYEFRIVGVTDLAGNIEAASEHVFKVVFKDGVPENEPILNPVVEDIEQVADNIFRVEFNRAGVVGTLEILNADGNGGLVRVAIPESTEDTAGLNKGKFFSYVAVPAMDNELYDPVLNVNILEKDNLLCYDGQDYIHRTVQAVDIETTHAGLDGVDYVENMTLYDDIFSPVVEDEVLDARDNDERANTIIDIPVVDVLPNSWAADDNAKYFVDAVKYVYDEDQDRFLNDIDPNNGDYMPLFVWYEDAKGLRHSALVHNQEDWVRPYDWDWYDDIDETLLNPGYPGSITYSNNTLSVDLDEYDELLDAEGNLVAGVTYHVEIPKGYFTDPARDILLTDYEYDCDDILNFPNGLSQDIQFSFGGEDYDMLYVDDARIPNFESILADILDLLSGNKELSEKVRCRLTYLGYTSIRQEVELAVDGAPAPEDPRLYVPQTSKELIHYDEATDNASRDSIWIEFTGDIDKTTLQNPENYMLFNEDTTVGDLGVVPADIVFDGSHGKQFAVINLPDDTIAEDGDYFFKVQGVSNTEGGTMTPVETVIHMHDNTHPYIVAAEISGQREIKLTFNEEIKYFVEETPTADKFSAAKNFLVNGGDYTVLEAIHSTLIDPTGREVVLVLGTNLPASGYIDVEVVEDQNGNVLFIDSSSNKNILKLETFEVR